MSAAKKKFVLNLLAFSIFAISFSYFCLDYLIKEVEISSSKIVDNKKSIYVLNSKNEQLPDLKKKYGDMEKKMDTAFEVIADRGNTVDFIKWSEEVARKNKVKLKMQVLNKDENASKKESGFISSSNFSFFAGGSFQNIVSFLHSMENCKYEVDISNVEMSVGDFDEYNKGVTVLNFNLKLYQKNSQK